MMPFSLHVSNQKLTTDLYEILTKAKNASQLDSYYHTELKSAVAAMKYFYSESEPFSFAPLEAQERRLAGIHICLYCSTQYVSPVLSQKCNML